MRVAEETEQTLTLEQWCSVVRPGVQVLRIRNGQSALCLSHSESSVQWCFPARWQGLLLWRPGLKVCAGNACVLVPSSISLVKLQFFIDQGQSITGQSASAEPWAVLRESGIHDQSLATLECWYLALAMKGAESYRIFARELRCIESYQLLGFLLKEGSNSAKLQHLAERYGVSTSHFRRLCHHALGNAPKSELREWRTARALLMMADGQSNLTDVALEFGYASSSHFSKEVRELVGVAPSSLIDITRLSSE